MGDKTQLATIALVGTVQDEVASLEAAPAPYAGLGVGFLAPPAWNIVQTQDLLDEIESSIRKVLPDAQVMTHPEPAKVEIPA
jgi:hypothetical protein